MTTNDQELPPASLADTEVPPPAVDWSDAAKASAEAQKAPEPPAEAKAEKKNPDHFFKTIRVKFTPQELERRVDELKKARTQRDWLEAEKKAAAKSFKKQNDLVEQLTTETCSGQGDVSVKCFERKVFENNTIETVRVDTGEVVDTRAMKSNDRQVGLLDPKPSKKLELVKPPKGTKKKGY